MEIFIDECGDLGFSEKSTKFFIISFLLAYNPWEVRFPARRLLKRLRQRRKYKHNELKFSKAKHNVRIKILEDICTYDCFFGFVILSKYKVHDHLRQDLNLLYRYVVIDPIMEMILPFLAEREKLVVNVDRSLSRKKVQQDFNSYVELKSYYFSKASNRQALLYRDQIMTNHVDSQKEPCLQIADCLAGAEFQRFERKIYNYHNIIDHKIRPELWRFLW